LGVVLTQFDDDGREFVVVYISQSNNKMKAKYSSSKGECLAVNTPLNSLKDPNVGLRANNEKKKVGARSLTYDTLGV
jgi:hypothetical protein